MARTTVRAAAINSGSLPSWVVQLWMAWKVIASCSLSMLGLCRTCAKGTHSSVHAARGDTCFRVWLICPRMSSSVDPTGNRGSSCLLVMQSACHQGTSLGKQVCSSRVLLVLRLGSNTT